ncbi:MAG: ABC transporter permease subunit [Butyrivibrio sp.]|nr:ABC transporter permease subunit [Butyrivibrio sp.]
MNRKVKYIFAVILSISGFGIAALLNLLIPQVADVTFEKKQVFGAFVDSNEAYRFVLLVLMAGYLIAGIVDYFFDKRRDKYRKQALFRFVCGIALFLWDLLGTKLQVLTQPFFPGPAGIMEAFISEGHFIWENTLYSLRLYASGFVLGVVLGVITGVLAGWFPKVSYWVSPVLKVIGVIPAVAWMPFALTLLPTAFTAAVFLIGVCVWSLVTTLTVSGVQSTPKTLLEAGRTLGGNELYLVFHVAIPNALPNIFTGITTANGYAFTTLVMAEMMGQPGGLGYYINASKVWSAYYKVFAAIIVMAVLFSIITWVIERIQDSALKWQKGIVK